MIDKNKMSLFCTSKCNLKCKECIMGNLMKACPNYEISIEEIRNLVEISESSGYSFFFTLSGGEPTLWSHLSEGIRILRNSSICIGIEIFTNAINISSFNKDVVSMLDIIRVSQYSQNAKNIKILKEKCGNKINIVNRTEFWPNPTMPIANSLPPKCLYDKSWYFNGNVYACAHSQSLIYTNPCFLHAKLCQPLKIGFLDGLEEIKKQQSSAVCTFCISNQKVRNQIKKNKNRSGCDTNISYL